ncbi:unnamed protein product, partial [Prorocentrum cordatum]
DRRPAAGALAGLALLAARRAAASGVQRRGVATMAASREQRFRTWPITEAKALEPLLQEMGLRVPAEDIDGTGAGASGRALSDTLVSVGPSGRGGTGSFISAEGLIVTNHHVALDAVRQASTAEHDHVTNGFVARSREEELAGPDYEVWITRSCEDVSPTMLEVLESEKDPLKRANRMRDKKEELAKERESTLGSTALRCEVKEMFADKSYVLFTFERLKDVRIVYVPPMSLGNFGGDTDNFEWPRHSADFTLLRAYCGPSGESAEPSPDNVPYRPSKYLRACSKGVSPGDFVFLLGFPGHTMRYAPSSRLAYSDEVAVPELIEDFSRKIKLIELHASEPRAVALKLLSTKKGLLNELKRSRGKRVMMRKLRLLDERRAEEAALCAAAPAAEGVYGELRAIAPRSAALDKLRGIYGGSGLLYAGHVLAEAAAEAGKPESEREQAYRERNRPYTKKMLVKKLGDLHRPIEVPLVQDAVAAARDVGLPFVGDAIGDVEKAVAASKLPSLSAAEVEALLAGEASAGIGEDPFVKAATAALDEQVAIRDQTKALISKRDKILAQLLDLQKETSEETLYPDANSTLRISAGHVEGYKAADAVEHHPITTLAGLVDKHMEAKVSGDGNGEFDCPERLVEVCGGSPEVSRTPVNCCYSTDTVGGNSGSPVLNAQGEFVAINFDRQRLGLMNEFKWSHSYSRSIGVDVRYILWLVGTYDSAPHLVKEMTG